MLVPQGKIALGKLAQALVHGAKLLQVNGNFDDCLALASKLSQDFPVSLVNSVNIYRLHGQKTAAFEIVEALGDAPDIHCLPVGNAGNISAYWMGYREDVDAGNSTKPPKMYGFQASGAAPIVTGQVVRGAVDDRHRDPDRQPGQLDQGAGRPGRLGRPDRRRSPTGRSCPRTGCWPARSASSSSWPARPAWPACCSRPRPGRCRPARRVVCTVTGHGLKDPEWAISTAPSPTTIRNDVLAAARALGLA